MNIQDIITPILEEILPRDPDKPIKGTHLITLLHDRGVTASPSTLGCAFSVMSSNLTTCLAKVDTGQGYYLRPHDERPRLVDTEKVIEQRETIEKSFRLIASLLGTDFKDIVEARLEQAQLIGELKDIETGTWEEIVG